MSNKTWIIFGIIVVGFLGLMIMVSENNRIDLDGVEIGQIIPANEDNGNIEEHVFGNPDSEVVLVEYGDYQCAGCASMSRRIMAIAEDYEDQIAFVFRNFTLDGHANALSAAAAAESANMQGRFWDMNKLLFDNQTEWATASVSERNELYMSYAQELGLDQEEFETGMQNPDIRRKIEFDKATAREAGLTGTPFFLINGEVIDNTVWADDDSFRALIDSELEKHGIEPPVIES